MRQTEIICKKPLLSLSPDQKIELSGKIQDNFFQLYQKLGIKIGFSQIYELAYIANKIVRSVSYNGSNYKSGRSFFIPKLIMTIATII